MHIGILGFGTFGQFLATHFREVDFHVSSWSRSDYSKQAEALGVEFTQDLAAFSSQEMDILLLAVSIPVFGEILGRIPWHTVQADLVVDVLSIKTFPKERMQQILPHHLDILCTHPMFGPDSGARSWEGLNFMYEKVRIRKDATCKEFLHFFESKGCSMIPMPCEQHDQFAARSQFLTHTTGRLLSSMYLSPTPINTKGYESLLTLMEQTTRDSFDLYYGLYSFNDHAHQELSRIEQALRQLRNQLFDREREERETQIIGIQGGEGSFNHQACMELIDKYSIDSYELRYLITSEKVLKALNEGEIDFGVFAIENSGSGTVLPSIYSMSKYSHEIIEIHHMPLVQCLLARQGQDVSKAQQIITHPQAIKQCAKTLGATYPHLSSEYLSDDFDTAECAKRLGEGKLPEDAVVIASKTAGERYGLQIVEEGINDDPENMTSFVFCRRREN